ncbi:mRNA cleavage and polyadenylation factor clp1 [Cyclospora cayetanensis]|uniref:mRNA cleavage and polyadenylation factor clp1 n=1 Tax=Cyclospora cayetanensis TaxID=88456 RepID=A0A6P6RZT7_9EIME|nr:mRNA cleavage and polyadenylation factor clp1 [Cyclospora cayetanensis]
MRCKPRQGVPGRQARNQHSRDKSLKCAKKHHRTCKGTECSTAEVSRNAKGGGAALGEVASDTDIEPNGASGAPVPPARSAAAHAGEGGCYVWGGPPVTASAPNSGSGVSTGPTGVDSLSSRRAVRLITLRPMRELRVLLPEPPEQEQGEGVFDERHTVAVKLLGSGGVDRGGPRGLRIGGSSAAAAAAGGAVTVSGISGAAASASAAGTGGAAAGTAEIFGCELLPEVEVSLPPAARLAVFSWGGCTLQIRGQVHQEYEAGDRAMSFICNLAAALNERRRAAAAQQTVGPRVLVTGSGGSGKSSVCQILCNYALREGWTPAFVELDARGSCDKGPLQLPPGCIGSCVCRYLDVEEPEDPLIFFVGSSVAAGGAAPEGVIGPGDISLELFPWLCSCLSAALHAAFAHSLLQHSEAAATGDPAELDDTAACNETHAPSLAASGLIANAPQQASLQQLQQLVELFGFDVVVVLDHPSLCHDLAGIYDHVLPDTAEEAAAQLQGLQQQQQLRLQQLGAAAVPPQPQRVEVVPLPKLEGTVAVDGDEPVLHLRVPGGMGDALGARLLLVPHDLRSMKCFLDG